MHTCKNCEVQSEDLINYNCHNCGGIYLCWDCIEFGKGYHSCDDCREPYEPSYMNDKKQLRKAIKKLLEKITDLKECSDSDDGQEEYIGLYDDLQNMTYTYFHFKKVQKALEKNKKLYQKYFDKK